MNTPKISIITITYNSVKTLQKTIDSYKSQIYPNRELIIIDGQSNDGTIDIIQENSSSINYWISQKDTGIPDALNKGIYVATGDWIYYLNSDDTFFDNNVLARIFSKSQGADMLYGNVILKSSNLLYDGIFDKRKLMIANICHQAQFFNKNIFTKLGVFDVSYKLLSDYDFNLRSFSDPLISIKYIDETIAVFDDSGRTSYIVDKPFFRNRRKNFMIRFRKQLSDIEIIKAYEQYFYYCFQRGCIMEGFLVLAEIIYYTKKKHYLLDACKLLKDRISTN